MRTNKYGVRGLKGVQLKRGFARLLDPTHIAAKGRHIQIQDPRY